MHGFSSTLTLLIITFNFSVLPSLASDCDCPQCLATTVKKKSVYESVCCDEANIGKAVKIKKAPKNVQLVLCPKEIPNTCSQDPDNDNSNEVKADCKEWYEDGYTTDGIYTVNPDGISDPFKVYCDMTTTGGGWTVFQKRMDGSVNFYRSWVEYEQGFGNLEDGGEFWFGLDKIHRLTRDSTNNTLRVDLWDFSNSTAHANYSVFSVGNASTQYRLTVDDYTGTAGDSLSYHNNQEFTTKDNDNDLDLNSCAVHWIGAWWFGACFSSHLNGLYREQSAVHAWLGVIWYNWKGSSYSLKATEMKLRRN